MKALEHYKLLIPFLGEALGHHVEIVLHDVRNLANSIVAISNGHISGRQVGSPATDYLLKLLQEYKDKETQHPINYYSKSFKGHLLRCSSYFIFDADELVGVLCINHDLDVYMKARESLDSLLLMQTPDFDIPNPTTVKGPIQEEVPKDSCITGIMENFYQTAEDAIEHMIDKYLAPYGVESERLSVKERKEVVAQLHESGLFLLKGGISTLATRLGVSEPTIYRYLQAVKQQGD